MPVETGRGDVDGQAERIDVDDVRGAEEVGREQPVVPRPLDLGAGVPDVRERLRDRVLGVDEIAAGDVDRGHEVRVLARRGRHHERSGECRFEAVGELGVAEVEERGLRERAGELVGAHDDDVGAERDRGGRKVGVEAEVRTPGRVDDEDRAGLVGHLGEGCDVGDRTEVARGDEVDGRDRLRVAADRVAQRIGGDAVGDAVDLIDVGGDEARVESGEDDAVDEARMGAALRDDARAEGADGQRRHPVAL